MKCQYPNCHKQATTTWALVPLCTGHHEAIAKETEFYYRKRISYDERVEYLAISDKIPWSRARKEGRAW